MARKQESLPHYGVSRGYTRNNAVVCIAPPKTQKDWAGNDVPIPAEFKQFQSINAAKRFMRTGAK